METRDIMAFNYAGYEWDRPEQFHLRLFMAEVKMVMTLIGLGLLCSAVGVTGHSAMAEEDARPVPQPSTAGPEGGKTVSSDIPYSIGNWRVEDNLGDHRARIRVAAKADAVRVHLPWRRHDSTPRDKDIIVVDAKTGQRIKNMTRVVIQREFAELVFQADNAPGEYFIYYLPYQAPAPNNYSGNMPYFSPKPTADAAWIERNGLDAKTLPEGKWKNLPQAEVLEFQARTEFDRFDPMEVIATEEETKALLARHAQSAYLLFPEDRQYPIRMTDDLPLRWIRKGPGAEFRGEALRGEFFAFQIGVLAVQMDLAEISVEFSALRMEKGAALPATAFRCFNTCGTDGHGQPLKKSFSVAKGKVGALWCGAQIPADAVPGKYDAVMRIRPKNAAESLVKLAVTVAPEISKDGGDGELWRHSRLRWLDSTLGIDDEVTAPFTPLQVENQTVKCLGREVTFDNLGFLGSIKSGAQEMLTGPMALVVETAEGKVAWAGGKAQVTRTAPGAVTWEAVSGAPALAMACSARMESDGHIAYRVSVKAENALKVKDIRLEIPLRASIATYLMGMNHIGGYRPKEWRWSWSPLHNSVWVGSVDAGLWCKLVGPDYWEINNIRQASLPQGWFNQGKGGCCQRRGAGNGLDPGLQRRTHAQGRRRSTLLVQHAYHAVEAARSGPLETAVCARERVRGRGASSGRNHHQHSSLFSIESVHQLPLHPA